MLLHQNIFNFSVENLFLSSDSSISFYKSLYLTADFITIEGKITASHTPSSILMVQSTTICVNKTANISDIEYIALYAKEIFTIGGVIQSFKQTCTYNLFSNKFFFNFVDKNDKTLSIKTQFLNWSKQRNLASSNIFILFKELLSTNYTIMLLSDYSINLDSDSSIKGARIGVFSQNLTLKKKAQITTTAYGCTADSGPGKGQSILHEENYCGGMGGSYGGYKGYGLGVIIRNQSLKESELCQSYARQIDSKEENLPYGGLEDPNYEGSGGGSGADNSKDKILNKGGSGGGIIILGILNNLTNNGLIESNGESTDRLCKNTTGPGAGSGGSIQIYLNFLSGSGNITASGGDSGFYCGEGGGGRTKVFFLNWNDKKLTTNLTAYWSGKILVNSGHRLGNDPTYSLDINNFKGSLGSKLIIFFSN